MHNTRQRMTSEQFHHRLQALQSKIDSLPEQHREMLRTAANEAREQHERMWNTSARIDDIVADLGLIVEHTKFHVAACQCELRELDPEGRFSL